MPVSWKTLAVSTVLSAMACGSMQARAETVMQQCGQQYQAAKAAGTLNGMTWNAFRTDCAAKLKAQPASVPATPAPASPAPPATQTANPLNPPAPAPAPASTTAVQPAGTATTAQSGGRAAFVTRERACGSEWRANKTTLIAQTPGLTWPKYLSQCNTRLKAAGK